MPETSPTGTTYLSAPDTASMEEVGRTVADSARTFITAGGASDAQVKADALDAAGYPATNARPLFVYRTDVKQLVVFDGSTWAPLTSRADGVSLAVQSGTATVTFNNQSSSSTSVVFPKSGLFTSTPAVFVSSPNGNLNAAQISVTTGGFTFTMTHVEGA